MAAGMMVAATEPEGRRWLASLLRKLADWGQFGHRRTPASLALVGGYNEYYWGLARDLMDFATYERVVALSHRYRRYVHHVTEVSPQWQVIDTIYFADNSVEVVERSKDGRSRRRMTVPPGGDRCV